MPFMYYSIPAMRRSSQGSVGSGSGYRQPQRLQQRQSAPAALMSEAARSAARSAVKRKSCVSVEVSMEEAISDLIESINGELEELDVGNEDESFDAILDQIINSDDQVSE